MRQGTDNRGGKLLLAMAAVSMAPAFGLPIAGADVQFRRTVFLPYPDPEPESEPERVRPWERERPHPEGPCSYRATGSKRARRRRTGR